MIEEVLIKEEAAGSRRIGFITLNAERTLNALKLSMIPEIAAALARWSAREDLVCVVIQANGPKAFCAGGDLQGLYESIKEQRQARSENRFAAAFFSQEYRLNYAIHTYPKPVLCWGHGLVMGGGIGIMAGASHRVVSETSRLAMPEISVGLFPDVGGSWILNRLPGRIGLFLALTGAQLDARDSVFINLADHFLPESSREVLLAKLCDANWSSDPESNRHLLTRELAKLEMPAGSPSPLRMHFERVQSAMRGPSLPEIFDATTAFVNEEDPWLRKAGTNLKAGCPTSAGLAYRFHAKVNHRSLAESFKIEYTTALQCCAHPDFGEGIRALLIDKDRNPRWTPASVSSITPRLIDEYFPLPPDLRQHPLGDLGEAPKST